MTKDYYKILDITEFSTQDEIKSAYRKLARKWHPDVAGNSDDVINKFKEINEAYEILSDKARKADYDTARRFYNYASGTSEKKETASTGNATNPNSKTSTKKEETKDSGKKFGFSFNWEEILSKKYAEMQMKNEQKKNAPKRGADINTEVEISVFEAINGTTKTINLLQTHVCPKCGGRKFVNGGVCKHCNGKGDVTSYKKSTVRSPEGIKDNSKIRLAGEGENGINGAPSGDLYLTVHVAEPKNYKTDGLNILKNITISPYEAVLGSEVSVPTVKGNVLVKIAPNTRNGQKIRLSGCGISNKGREGDMIVTVEIQIPTNVSNEEVELYKRLREIALKGQI
ncbi:DnaJ domain-containing protein [bacterium]|nr:DnaJ domain-containing protein [bacterium]